MADLNSGDLLSLYQGSRLIIGSDEVINIESGSVRIVEPAPEQYEHRDRGVYRGTYIIEQPLGSLEFTVKTTISYPALRAILKPTPSDGKVGTLASMVVEVPAYRNATSGVTLTISNAWVQGDIVWQENREQFDQVPFTMMHDAGAPMYGTFTGS